MANTHFNGPVVSAKGFNSDKTLSAAADFTAGAFNLTDFTVRPARTWTGTVAALVGAANSRTAGVSGGTIIGCYAQTSMGSSSTTVITGLNTAIYGVCDLGSSTSVGTCFVATLDFTSWGTRANKPTAFIGFGDEAPGSYATPYLFAVGTPSKNVSTAANGDVLYATDTPNTAAGSLRILVNNVVRYIPLLSAQSGGGSSL